MKEKAYPLHEIAYVKMKQQGIKTWNERGGYPDVDPGEERFLLDAMAQPWFPQQGRVLDVGCGTGPFTRWFAWKGYTGLGIDISKTAIAMAKDQSKDMPLRFRVADICTLDPGRSPKFDVCLDGNCFHCIIDPKDRMRMLVNCRQLLKPNGLFILKTMCSPANVKNFNTDTVMKLFRNYIYVPHPRGDQFEEGRTFSGKPFFPNRYVGHWKDILSDVAKAGFSVEMFRFANHTADEPCSGLAVCARVKQS